ncbi:MAG: signal peptidase II [Candidatus Gastranaerophilales bacterium]|nr:signal peptidase II [Candidatus Gastranaerophilales bacterium]
MADNKIKNIIIFFSIAAICIISDQLVKFFVNQNLAFNVHYSLINNLIGVNLTYNTGAGFSIFQNQTLLLSVVSAAVSGFIIWYIFAMKNLKPAYYIALGFILGGAAGNLIDRLVYSYVIDFLRLEFINFPVFNLADIFINIGAIILIVQLFTYKK